MDFGFKYFLLIFFFGNAITVHAQGDFKIKEIGTPFIENFSSEDYDGSNQVWAITQDTSGLLYFGLQNRLLEYDGVNFKTFLLESNSSFRALETTKDNQVFFGNYNVFGRLRIDSSNTTNFEELQSLIELEERQIGRINKIIQFNDQVVIHSFNGIFLFNRKEVALKVIPLSENFNSISLFNNRLLAVKSGEGIYELKDEKLQLLTEIESANGESISRMVTFSKDELLLTTKTKLYIYDFNGIRPWDNAISRELENSHIYSIIDINGQYTSIGTRDNGLFILDRGGKLIQRLTMENGLPSNQILTQFVDNNNSLWLGTGTGVSHILLESPLTILDNRSGIEGSVLRLKMHKGYLYCSTQQGIFYRRMSDPWQSFENAKPFSRLQNHRVDSWWFESFGEDLLSAARDGLLLIEKEDFKVIFDTPMSFISPINDSTLMAIGGQGNYNQYLFKKRDGQWNFIKEIKGLDEYADRAFKTKSGKYWHSNVEVGLFSYHYDSDYDSTLSLTKYDEKDGLPSVSDNIVFTYLDEPIFGTLGGFMRYDEKERRIKKFNGFDQYLNDKYAFHLKEFENQDLFVSVGEGKMYLNRTSDSELTYEVVKEPFLKVANYNNEFVYEIEDKSILIATNQGALHYDANMHFQLNAFNTRIRSAHTSTAGDSLIYGGMGMKRNSKLPYSENALKFTFAATFYDENDKTVYSYQLSGFEEAWSEWSVRTEKEYTNLSHGDYSFLVKSKNIYDQEGTTASFDFSILPPWYFTYYAYAGYFGLFILFVWSIVKLNSRRLIKEKKVLEQVVTERTEEINDQNISLEKQSKKLQELDKVKSRFFANISHELRTPITLINGPIDAMLKGEYGKVDGVLEEGLTVVKNNGRNLSTLVDEILDLTKLEAGKLKLTENPVQFHSFLEELLGAYHTEIKSRQIDFVLDYQYAKEVSVLIDEAKFSKIINNLLSNAFKFTSDKGQIIVTVQDIESNLSIGVKDNGQGIHPDDIAHVFERFYQSEQAESKAQGGTGIGLALSQELAKLYQGSIVVSSSLGQGSEFIFAFPPKIVDSNITEAIVEEFEVGVIETNLEATIVKYINIFDIEKPVLLITEDHKEMRHFIGQIVGKYFSILQASNGVEALDMLKNNRVDMIISDVMMPKMDGFELLENIKGDEALQNISMIMLTARAAEEDKLFALTLGVDDYLTKPFSQEELLVRSRNILDNRMVRKMAESEASSNPDELPNIEVDFVNDLKNIIEKNIADSLLTVSYLASQVALSERQLQRKTKSLTGFSPIQFITEVKLQKAKTVLSKKQVASVSEASYLIGFDNVTYFSSQFVNRFGKRPSEYL